MRPTPSVKRGSEIIDTIVDKKCIEKINEIHSRLKDLAEMESNVKSLQIEKLNAISTFIQAHSEGSLGLGTNSVKEATAKGLEIIKSL
jgi:hypothetical protein